MQRLEKHRMVVADGLRGVGQDSGGGGIEGWSDSVIQQGELGPLFALRFLAQNDPQPLQRVHRFHPLN